MPTKIAWSFDGKESKIVKIKTGTEEPCIECGGYTGHFNNCSILKKELEKSGD